MRRFVTSCPGGPLLSPPAAGCSPSVCSSPRVPSCCLHLHSSSAIAAAFTMAAAWSWPHESCAPRCGAETGGPEPLDPALQDMVTAPLLPPEEGQVENLLFLFCSVPPWNRTKGTWCPQERDALSCAPCPTMEPGECRTTHSDHTSGRTAFQVGPLCSTSLPHRGGIPYVSDSPVPACTVSGGLARVPRMSRWLLRNIRLGHAIQFARRPPKFRSVRFTSVLNKDAPVLHAKVAVLLTKDAIEPVPPAEIKSGFYSPYFIIPKKGGGLRPILDLHILNQALH